MSQELSPTTMRFYEKVMSFIQEHKYSPSFMEMARYAKITSGPARTHLERLVNAGLLVYEGHGKGIQVPGRYHEPKESKVYVQLAPKILASIEANIEAVGYPPSRSELADEFGVSNIVIHNCFSYLENKGQMTRSKRGGHNRFGLPPRPPLAQTILKFEDLAGDGYVIFRSNGKYTLYRDWRAFEDGRDFASGGTFAEAIANALAALKGAT